MAVLPPSFVVSSAPPLRSAVRHVPATCSASRPGHQAASSQPGRHSSLRELRAALVAAVAAERFSEAALLRDEIEAVEAALPDDAAVSAANDAFYDAFREADVDAMGEVWLRADSVSCAHPMAGLVTGYDNVLDSWQALFTMGRPTGVQVAEVSANVRRNVAWLVCRQEVQAVRGNMTIGGVRIATNVFQKRRGRWSMVHHHASPVVAENSSEN